MKRNAFRRGLSLPFVLAVVAALLAAPPGAGLLAEEEKPEKPKDSGDAQDGSRAREKGEKGKAAEPKVYTNKDLKRYRDLAATGRPAGAVVIDTAPAVPAAAPEEPTAALTPGEKDLRMAELRGEIAAAEARLAALDQRERSVRNPFLPRPQLTEEEREAEAGLGGKEIVQRIQAERAELRQKVASLRDEMERVAAAPTRHPSEPASPTTPASPQPPP